MEKEERYDRIMLLQDAGRKGGMTTLKKYGPDHYSEIGQRGGKATFKKYGPELYAEMGRKGGRKSRENARLAAEHDKNTLERLRKSRSLYYQAGPSATEPEGTPEATDT